MKHFKQWAGGRDMSLGQNETGVLGHYYTQAHIDSLLAECSPTTKSQWAGTLLLPPDAH